ncbi:MAG: right-handed parallel beta-helix repeat-containing protein, partial [archaeon]
MSKAVFKKKWIIILATIIFLFPIEETNSIECDSCALCDQYADTYDFVELNQSISNFTATCIDIAKDNTTIDCKGFNISGSGVSGSYGIKINRNNITIKNCTIEYFFYGAYLLVAQNGTLTDNVIKSNTQRGIHLTGNSIYNNLTKNIILNNTYGIYIQGSNSNKMTTNNITKSTYGITIVTSNNNTIYNNKIKNNTGYEINVTGENNNISNNYFKNDVLPDTNYPPTTIFENNIFADWTAGPLTNYLSDFATITEAVTAASADDVIYVFKRQSSESYNECLDITKTDLTINGEERDATRINCTTGTATNITSDSVSFSNFTFESYDSDYPVINLSANNAYISNITITDQKNGIQIQNSDNNILEHLDINNTKHAINITNSDNTTIKQSAFINTSMGAIDSTGISIQNNTFTTLEASDDTATIFENTNDSIIENNTYENTSISISIDSSRNTNITGNILKGKIIISMTPIMITNSTQSVIYQNLLTGFEWGITLENSDAITIDQNTINDITSSSSSAIQVTRTNNTNITNNTLNISEIAISIRGGDSNTIYNNTITGASNTSIMLNPDYSAPLTLLRNNTIEKNTIEDTGTAISLNRTYGTKVTQNTIKNTTSPSSLYITNSSHDNITYNTLEQGTNAIEFRSAGNGLIQGNTIINYTTHAINYDYDPSSQIYNYENTIRDNIITGGTDAIYIKRFNNSTITNNTITGTTNKGIYTTDTNYTNITENTITYSFSGIELFMNTENTILDKNTISHINNKGITSDSVGNTDITISRNHIENATYGLYLSDTIKLIITENIIENSTEINQRGAYIFNIANASIKNNTFSYLNYSGNYGIYLMNTNTSNITGNRFQQDTTGLYITGSEYNNITENIFTGNIIKGIELTYQNNSLWMNNFSDSSNDFGTPEDNEYCIMGLDNHYSSPAYDSNWSYTCPRNFENSLNDTVIYVNDTIEFMTNTSVGESNITTLNITINNTNHTMTLKSGNNIKGIWTYEFSDTFLPGTYNATLIYYYEADDDEGAENISLQYKSFEVTELNLSTQIYSSNRTEPAWAIATVTNNATQIEYVISELYWNDTLIGSANQTEYTKYGNNWTYNLQLNNTNRSGAYIINTTIAAGQTRTVTDTFIISYGTAAINIDTMPNILAYNMTTPQNYTITAENGDLNNITITFQSNDTSAVEITPASWHIDYMNASDMTQLQISITPNKTGTYRITINSTPENGTYDTKTKDIQVRKINMTADTYPKTANVTQYITLAAYIQNNATEITGVNAAIYWNGTLQDTLSLNQSGTISGDGDDNTYRYNKTANITQRSGNYTINFIATATNNATATEYYYISYGTINITISPSPSEMNTNTTKIQYVNITAVNGDLKNITATITIDNTSILNISSGETTTKSYWYLNSTHTWNLSWQLNATSTTNTTINITAEAHNTTTTSRQKTITIKELTLNASLTPATINITGNTVEIYANISGNITKIEYVTANVTWNATSKQNITLEFHHYYP